MINRVTQQTVQRSTLANVQMNLAKMSDAQSRLSGGKIITKPSDDPAGTAQAMTLRAERRSAEQYNRNADDGVAWLSRVDSALQASTALVRNVRDLTVQGANTGALSATAREGIAQNIEGLRDALLDQANTKVLGRSVFAGTTDAPAAFTGPTAAVPYDWTGVAAGSVDRRVSPDTIVRADADGAAVFGSGATSVFALLDTIAADLRAGVNVNPRLAELDTRLDAMLGEVAGVGARYSQMLKAQVATAKEVDDLSAQLSGVEDIDLAATILDLQMQEVAYKGALGAASRVLQPTLLDFLR